MAEEQTFSKGQGVIVRKTRKRGLVDEVNVIRGHPTEYHVTLFVAGTLEPQYGWFKADELEAE